MEKTLTAAQIRSIRSLQQKKFRQETSLFVVEGEKLVGEALDSGFEVEGVYRTDEIGLWSVSPPCPPLLPFWLCSGRKSTLQTVSH